LNCLSPKISIGQPHELNSFWGGQPLGGCILAICQKKNILFKILEFFGHQFNDFLKKTNCQNFIIIKYIVQADSKIYIWGCFNFSPSCFINSQTWLNQLMDDHHPNYITKVEKRQKNKTPLHSAYMWIPLPICSKHTHTHTHIYM
jgi:hypothetical protein